MTTYITDRIAIDPDICNGRPIIRGMRITVQTILEFLFAGTPREELLHQYPMLESEDIDACQQFAIKLMEKHYVIHEIKNVA
ncbi:DUF433 domain-containing protein [Runella slithyformis]|uniref:DUF433 domain-containing protein n=1 Tax=Runella slithyformis (strain ATCC 29530 / DSM 19594 / LMG 11500 / NCIMB 11436 / LSU 4) TaxID=761193 RepID=A0A7U3ZJE7_RUNSL|nr:DUF433 domain-containing protein [Runella slithyformis]AEI48262.1 protein of unknown function DUF433 [Runella slithyformis DSM 19594]